MISGLTIDRVEIIPLDLVPTLKRTLPTGPIRYGADNWAGRPVLVCVRAGGLAGWGQIRPVNPFQGDTAASAVAALRDFYAPLMVGRNPWHRAAIMRDCERVLPANPAARAAADVALHDLLGTALEVPVHALLGGACRDEIQLEWSVGLGETDAMVREAVEAFERFGIRYICIKVGPAMREAEDCRVVQKIRKALGSQVHLALDANGSFRAREAIRLARRLADADLAYFEQPVPGWAVDELKRVRDGITVPVMADESVYSPQDAIRVMNAGAADVLGIKLYKCGGLWRGRQIAAVAEAGDHDVNCAGTANASHLEALAAAHLGAAVPNHAFGAEFTMGLPIVIEDPIAPGEVLPVADGRCAVPQGPGLGVAVDEKAVAHYALTRIIVDTAA